MVVNPQHAGLSGGASCANVGDRMSSAVPMSRIAKLAWGAAHQFFAGDRLRIKTRAEAFNVFNHANFVGYNGTYGNGAAPATLGLPLTGITSQLPARSMQFSLRIAY